MAILVVDQDFALDLHTFNLNGIYAGSEYHRGSDHYRIGYSGGAVDDFRGNGFEYNSNGELTAGTITLYEGFRAGEWTVTISGSFSAAEFAAAARTASTEDDFDLYAKLFGGADYIAGSRHEDWLQGFGGDDAIRGFAGNDVIDGDKGADAIIGGRGGDTLVAGKDNARDVFLYNSIRASGETEATWDRILQFDRYNDSESVWDRIDLSSIDADNELKCDQSFRFVSEFTKVGSNKTEGQVRIEDLGADVNVHVDLNGDTNTDMIISVVGVGTLSAADLWL